MGSWTHSKARECVVNKFDRDLCNNLQKSGKEVWQNIYWREAKRTSHECSLQEREGTHRVQNKKREHQVRVAAAKTWRGPRRRLFGKSPAGWYDHLFTDIYSYSWDLNKCMHVFFSPCLVYIRLYFPSSNCKEKNAKFSRTYIRNLASTSSKQ